MSAIPPLTDREFRQLRDLVHRESGIFLSDAKKALLVSRLGRRLRELRLGSFGAYYRRVAEDRDPEELVRMIDCICTNETHFFREPRQFELLERQILPRWIAEAESRRRPRRIRAWSAGCSTGQEPYSLAMLLCDHVPPSTGWDIEILGTDLSTRALERAGDSIWPVEKSSEIPHAYLKRFMLRGTGSRKGQMKAGPEIRALVRFARVNLKDETYPVSGTFDVVFCRNVLIYFDSATRTRIVERLISRLVPGGYLFLGHAESLGLPVSVIRSPIPSVYVKTSETADRPRLPDTSGLVTARLRRARPN